MEQSNSISELAEFRTALLDETALRAEANKINVDPSCAKPCDKCQRSRKIADFS